MTDRSFDPATLLRAAQDTFTVRTVFGEAYERDGALVVPVARVLGATGTGAGSGGADRGTGDGGEAHGTGDGGGGGLVTHVAPLGVFVVRDGRARWEPVLDLGRVVAGGQVVAAVVTVAWALAWAVRRR